VAQAKGEAMKALKIAGLVLLVLWMAFITIAVLRAVKASEAACAWARAANRPPHSEGVTFCAEVDGPSFFGLVP